VDAGGVAAPATRTFGFTFPVDEKLDDAPYVSRASM
jgi:hypothetical protein